MHNLPIIVIVRGRKAEAAIQSGNPACGWAGLLRSRCSLAMTIIVGILLAFGAAANTVTTERTSTTLISEVKTIHAGDKFWVALHIGLQPGWHTYWVNAGDSGITPQLNWTLPNGFTAGPTQYVAPDREHVGPLVDYAYDKDAYYLVPITPPPVLRDGTTTILALKANWLVCKDICIPESGELSLALPAGEKSEPGDDAALMASLVGKLPMPVAANVTFHSVAGEISFEMPLASTGVASDQIKTALFFPESQQLIANAAEQKVSVKPASVSITVQQAEGQIADNASGVVSLYLNDGSRKDYSLQLQSEHGAAQTAAVVATPIAPATPSAPEPIAPPPPKQASLLEAVWYALIGGLILNCMPCVFPVLSLKALAVAKKASAHPTEARRQGIAYTLGVIVSFLALAFALLAFQKSGQAVGWGYQMQSPEFVSVLALLLFLVGLNLAGYFELPVLLGNVGNEEASKDSVWGSFLTGVLAVAVATPCTAPFMAPAIGFALTQNALAIFAVFAGLGLGLSSPFLLISFFPATIRALPKPGAWMNTFKELLSFPMFGWTAWLVWILAREAGPEAALAVLLGFVFVTFALWLWRREAGFVKFLSILAAVGGIGFTLYAAHMPMVQTMTLPAAYEKTDHFSESKLSSLRKEGRAVFVDATADWCLICKVNESTSLSTAAVMKAFKDKNVAYLVADWTHGDAEITHYLESFGRSGVPIYVYYPPNGGPVVLPQVLTPSAVLEVLQ